MGFYADNARPRHARHMSVRGKDLWARHTGGQLGLYRRDQLLRRVVCRGKFSYKVLKCCNISVSGARGADGVGRR